MGGRRRHRELFRWKHETNPFGPSPGWVVEHDGEIVARATDHALGVPPRRRRVVRAVRAVDTATRPRPPGRRAVLGADHASAVAACRADGVGVRVQHPERPEPARLPQARLARRRPAAGRDAPASLGQLLTSGVAGSRPICWSVPIDIGVEVGTWLGRSAGGAGRRPGDDVSSTDRALRTALDDRRAAVALRAARPALPGRRRRRRRHRSSALRRAAPAASWSSPSASAHRRGPTGWPASSLADVDATHALRLGAPDLRHGFLPLPGARTRSHVAGPRRPRPSPAAQLALRARRHRALLSRWPRSLRRLRSSAGPGKAGLSYCSLRHERSGTAVIGLARSEDSAPRRGRARPACPDRALRHERWELP